MRPDDVLLVDMLEATRDAVAFVEGCSCEDLEKDRMRQLAVVKAIEVIGEAASKLSEEFRAGHPELPWRQIVGMRHRLVHDYFGIDLEQIWRTVQSDLPDLLTVLSQWTSHGQAQ